MTARRGAALSGCGGIATDEVKKLARTWPDGVNTSWYRGGASSMTSSIAEVASETKIARTFGTDIRPSIKIDVNKSLGPRICSDFGKDFGTPSGQDFGQDIGPNFGTGFGPNFGPNFGTEFDCYGV